MKLLFWLSTVFFLFHTGYSEIKTPRCLVEPDASGHVSAATLRSALTDLRIIDQNAFYKCDTLTSIEIPSSVDIIGMYAFDMGQGALQNIPETEVTFENNENNLLVIQIYAFRNKKISTASLTRILNAPNLRDIMTYAFYLGSSSYYYKQYGDVVIPSKVQYIGDYAFYNTHVKSLQLPESLTYIGEKAFYSYYSSRSQLTEVALPSKLVTCQQIGQYAFRGNQITTITFPENIQCISWALFYRNKLVNLDLSHLKSLDYIKSYAFENNQITTLKLGPRVRILDTSSFSNNNIQDVFIPDTVTTVGYYVFLNNPIESLYIGSNVSYVGLKAFYQDKSYSDVTFKHLRIMSKHRLFPDVIDGTYIPSWKRFFENGKIQLQTFCGNTEDILTSASTHTGNGFIMPSNPTCTGYCDSGTGYVFGDGTKPSDISCTNTWPEKTCADGELEVFVNSITGDNQCVPYCPVGMFTVGLPTPERQLPECITWSCSVGQIYKDGACQDCTAPNSMVDLYGNVLESDGIGGVQCYEPCGYGHVVIDGNVNNGCESTIQYVESGEVDTNYDLSQENCVSFATEYNTNALSTHNGDDHYAFLPREPYNSYCWTNTWGGRHTAGTFLSSDLSEAERVKECARICALSSHMCFAFTIDTVNDPTRWKCVLCLERTSSTQTDPSQWIERDSLNWIGHSGYRAYVNVSVEDVIQNPVIPTTSFPSGCIKVDSMAISDVMYAGYLDVPIVIYNTMTSGVTCNAITSCAIDCGTSSSVIGNTCELITNCAIPDFYALQTNPLITQYSFEYYENSMCHACGSESLYVTDTDYNYNIDVYISEQQCKDFATSQEINWLDITTANTDLTKKGCVKVDDSIGFVFHEDTFGRNITGRISSADNIHQIHKSLPHVHGKQSGIPSRSIDACTCRSIAMHYRSSTYLFTHGITTNDYSTAGSWPKLTYVYGTKALIEVNQPHAPTGCYSKIDEFLGFQVFYNHHENNMPCSSTTECIEPYEFESDDLELVEDDQANDMSFWDCVLLRDYNIDSSNSGTHILKHKSQKAFTDATYTRVFAAYTDTYMSMFHYSSNQVPPHGCTLRSGSTIHYNFGDKTSQHDQSDTKFTIRQRCPTGKYDHDNSIFTPCVVCEVGHETNSETGATSCEKCKYDQLVDQTYDDDGLSSTPCIPTTTTNEVCNTGINEDGQVGQAFTPATATTDAACTVCPNGKVAAISVNNTHQTTCDLCSGGYGGDGSQCTLCTDGKFQVHRSAIDIPCANKTCDQGMGVTDYENNTHGCEICRFDEFSDSPTTGQCEVCSGNKYTADANNQYTSTHAVSCLDCPSGKHQDNSGGDCESCPPGEYRDVDGDGISCIPCTGNSYVTVSASDSTYAPETATACALCPVGKHQSNDDPNGPCEDCPPFHISSNGEDCQSCADNEYTEDLKTCVVCDDFKFSDTGECKSLQQLQCPLGEYLSGTNPAYDKELGCTDCKSYASNEQPHFSHYDKRTSSIGSSDMTVEDCKIAFETDTIEIISDSTRPIGCFQEDYFLIDNKVFFNTDTSLSNLQDRQKCNWNGIDGLDIMQIKCAQHDQGNLDLLSSGRPLNKINACTCKSLLHDFLFFIDSNFQEEYNENAPSGCYIFRSGGLQIRYNHKNTNQECSDELQCVETYVPKTYFVDGGIEKIPTTVSFTNTVNMNILRCMHLNQDVIAFEGFLKSSSEPSGCIDVGNGQAKFNLENTDVPCNNKCVQVTYHKQCFVDQEYNDATGRCDDCLPGYKSATGEECVLNGFCKDPNADNYVSAEVSLTNNEACTYSTKVAQISNSLSDWSTLDINQAKEKTFKSNDSDSIEMKRRNRKTMMRALLEKAPREEKKLKIKVRNLDTANTLKRVYGTTDEINIVRPKNVQSRNINDVSEEVDIVLSETQPFYVPLDFGEGVKLNVAGTKVTLYKSAEDTLKIKLSNQSPVDITEGERHVFKTVSPPIAISYGSATGEVAISGCTNENAFNYDETADVDDNSCVYSPGVGNAIISLSDPGEVEETAWDLYCPAGEYVHNNGNSLSCRECDINTFRSEFKKDNVLGVEDKNLKHYRCCSFITQVVCVKMLQMYKESCEDVSCSE